MDINRSNYEEFFLDYIDGNLPQNQLAAFNAFLLANPDLAEELDDFNLVEIPQNELSLGDKSFLKKPISKYEQKDVFEETCIAFLEGDLNDIEKHSFVTFLNENPKSKNEFHLFEQARLKADVSIVFENKQMLKKVGLTVVSRKKILTYAISVGSLAASIVLMLGYYLGAEHRDPLLTFQPKMKIRESIQVQAKVLSVRKEQASNTDLLAYVETVPDGKGNPVSKNTQTTNKSTSNKTNKPKTQPTSIDKAKTEIVLPQNNSKMGIMYQLNGVQMIEVKKKDDLTFNLPAERRSVVDSTGRLMAFLERTKQRLLPESLKGKKEIGISDIAQSINKVASEYIKLEHTIDQSSKTEIYAINIVGYEFSRTKSLK